jgi:neutral ceramidase
MRTLAVRVSLLAGVLATCAPATLTVPASARPPADPAPSADCRTSSTFRVGTGIYDITGPAAEQGMMGYAAHDQKTAGIHLRLRSRAFVIESPCNGKRVAIVSADLGQAFQAVTLEVVRRLQQKYGLVYGAQNVLLSATHTHGGPGGYSHYLLYNLTVLGFSEENFEAIVNGIYLSIVRAHENLADGLIKLNRGDLTGASRNRSPQAYEANPELERKKYSGNTDTLMTLLLLEKAGDRPIGTINWFPVHGTSMSNRNRLITGDNKGYASYRFEKSMGTDYQAAETFVAAFAQANEGDVTPNVYGPPDGRGAGDVYATEQSGLRQYLRAWDLYRGAKRLLTGPVDYEHVVVDLGAVSVAANFTGGGRQKTCPPAIGLSMLAGAEDGPGYGYEGVGCEQLALLFPEPRLLLSCAGEKDPCHEEKPVVLKLGPPWTPQVLPLQIIRIGNLALAAVPFELTTMAGRRLRETVAARLEAVGVDTVVIAGLSNAYAGYVTTREEYRLQHYEGASTHFGPWTLAALQQTFDRLAGNMGRERSVSVSSPPASEPSKVVLQTGVVFDAPPLGRSFGDVERGARPLYTPGQTVEVSFWGAHPKNDLRIQDSFLEVQRQERGGSWVTLARDGDWETRFQWEREGLAASRITVFWNIPGNAQQGAYRIQHCGRAKNPDGSFLPYSGTSNDFYVVSPSVANAIRKKIGDGGQPCTNDQACAGGACIRPPGSPAGYCASPLAGCKAPRGRTPGCACSANELCGSGRCLYGLCVPQGCKVPPQECSQDNDCCGRPWSAALSCRTYVATAFLTVRTCAP